MKIKLNEKDKELISNVTSSLVKGADYVITDIGCLCIGSMIFKEQTKAICFSLPLAIGYTAFRTSDDYRNRVNGTVNKACNWVFNKLENSDQKVIEFEK